MPVTVLTAESPDQTVVETVRGWLSDITRENGFYTDLAGVYLDKPVDKSTPLPFVFLTDDGMTFEKGVIDLSLIIVGVVQEQRGDERKAGRRLAWDVRRCIRKHQRDDPVCGFKVAITESFVQEPENQSSLVYPTVTCSVTFPDAEIKARY